MCCVLVEERAPVVERKLVMKGACNQMKALVVGGNSGIGLACVLELLQQGYEHVYIVGKGQINEADIPNDVIDLFKGKTSFVSMDLTFENYDIFDTIQDISALYITVGFGRVALFEALTQTEIKNLMKCNALAVMQVIKKYYHKIKSQKRFDCAVMVSIAGHVASPFFSVYGASKFALAAFIENINVELAAEKYENRILDVSPGSLKGTAFRGGRTNTTELALIVREIISRAKANELCYIPNYEETYKDVLDRYHDSPMEFGLQSYNYKANGGLVSDKPQVVIGYLSGTFDLFHIGHLNLLRKAKEQCDYLIVGVHESGAWKGKQTFIPFEERKAIVESVRYVDKAIKSYPEDCDVWNDYHYHKLFVGSDYKGSERFNRYEEYFKDKGVSIVYFPYTQGTSSTQLREKLSHTKLHD